MKLNQILGVGMIGLVLMGEPGARAAPIAKVISYPNAFASIDTGHIDAALKFTKIGHDPILNKIIESYGMAEPGTPITFEELEAFIKENPHWPNLNSIIAIAEQKLPNTWSDQDIIEWFTQYQPQTSYGYNRYIDTLFKLGSDEVAERVIRTHWLDSSFSHTDLISFYNRYHTIIKTNLIWDRCDRLFWKKDTVAMEGLYPLLSPNEKLLAETRVALSKRSRKAQKMLSRLPPSMRTDSGVQFELARWNLLANQTEKTVEILFQEPEKQGHADVWWEVRQLLIRRLIEKHDYARAFRLAAFPGDLSNKNQVQADFLAGWLALRFLHNNQEAEKFFQRITTKASTPISRARGFYWLGRTYDALDDSESAEQYFKYAAALYETYYGQLALTQLASSPIITLGKEPEPPKERVEAFRDQDLVQAVLKLSSINQQDRVHQFFKQLLLTASDRTDFVLLMDLSQEIKRPDIGIEVSKIASQNNFMITARGFPLLDNPLKGPPEPALIYALIRQESMFNTAAESSVGAMGLMQLMPATAKAMAREMGLKFRISHLDNPDYNIKLGLEYIQDLLKEYNDSYVLSLAAYNAGPARVAEWIAEFGDPRNPSVDPIDWVELIGSAETRNYVQRILENLQNYRAEENNGSAPLLLLNDLRR